MALLDHLFPAASGTNSNFYNWQQSQFEGFTREQHLMSGLLDGRVSAQQQANAVFDRLRGYGNGPKKYKSHLREFHRQLQRDIDHWLIAEEGCYDWLKV